MILEHRLVMEQKIGRFLERGEVVDHVDGNTLNNHPDNLRLFETNGAHLRETLTGRKPLWSEDGEQRLRTRDPNLPKVDSHRQKKGSGVLRTQRILRARAELDTTSPFLSGTERYLENK